MNYRRYIVVALVTVAIALLLRWVLPPTQPPAPVPISNQNPTENTSTPPYHPTYLESADKSPATTNADVNTNLVPPSSQFAASVAEAVSNSATGGIDDAPNTNSARQPYQMPLPPALRFTNENLLPTNRTVIPPSNGHGPVTGPPTS